jgi:hypothetical protein
MKIIRLLLVTLLLPLALIAQPVPLPDELAFFAPAEPFKAFLATDIQRLEPDALIIRAGDHVRVGNGHAVRKDAARGKSSVYLEIIGDWIEPVVAAPSPGIIRLALVQGTVEAAPPGQPEAFAPVAVGTELAPGTFLRTGPDSQAAVTLGNRSTARFIAGTTGQIEFATTPEGTERTRLKLKGGAVFSRIKSFNKDVDYQVQTPLAIAAARGTDFVTVALPTVTDVWIAEGTVELLTPEGQSIGRVSADEPGALKIIRSPAAPDVPADVAANTLTMSVAMSLIPSLNQNASEYRAATQPTPEQIAYLGEVRRVSYYIKATQP